MNFESLTPEQLAEIGAKTWQGRKVTRHYLNDWQGLIGLEISLYGTGNISGATLAGEKISNGKAIKLGFRYGKVWIENGLIRGKDVSQETFALVRKAIEAKLAE